MSDTLSFQEFLNALQKRGSKPHKISHCFGSRDAWKWVRKNHWQSLGGEPFDQQLYSKIINMVNLSLVELLLEGHSIEFPYQMGSLILSSLPARIALEGGEWKTNYRTDWKKTLLAWFEDAELMNTHKPVKKIQKEIYFVRFCKRKAVFKQKRFYKFRVNRSLAKKLGAKIESGRMCAEKLI